MAIRAWFGILSDTPTKISLGPYDLDNSEVVISDIY
jgi:hypothetical protein